MFGSTEDVCFTAQLRYLLPFCYPGSTQQNTLCGRYRLTAKERYIRDHFDLDEDPSWTSRWNIAPTQLVPIVRQKNAGSRRSFDLVRWGLIPSWAKDRSIATKTINAVAETAAEKPAFREAIRFRRRLIPSDSFYEWQPSGAKQKQPFSIGMADDSFSRLLGSGSHGSPRPVMSLKPAQS